MRLFEIKEAPRSTQSLALADSSTRAAGTTKQWHELESGEWDEALRDTPYIEVVGEMHFELLGAFGGFGDHVKYRFFELHVQLAQWFIPVHQRYRWYPPRGTVLFEASSLAERLCGWLLRRETGDRALNLVKECGFIVRASVECVGLILPEGDRALLIIGIPSENDGRYERTPWLHAILRPPFDGVGAEWRDLVRDGWDDAWNGEG